MPLVSRIPPRVRGGPVPVEELRVLRPDQVAGQVVDDGADEGLAAVVDDLLEEHGDLADGGLDLGATIAVSGSSPPSRTVFADADPVVIRRYQSNGASVDCCANSRSGNGSDRRPMVPGRWSPGTPASERATEAFMRAFSPATTDLVNASRSSGASIPDCRLVFMPSVIRSIMSMTSCSSLASSARSRKVLT
jgi:hypothetical protein